MCRIIEAENTLSNLIGELKANEFDMQGLKKNLKIYLHG
jgi:shikimate 5-dehydrogenase